MSIEPDYETDRGPFAVDQEAALCRQVMGGRAHGLDTLVEVDGYR
ncbi:hypothetical protein [Pseudonocardia lacus]|jgi:hypothetical protein|nr:hypothetical protein [Pseudonocardia lacus]